MDTHFQNIFTVIGQYCYGQVPQHLKSHNGQHYNRPQFNSDL